MHRTYHEIQKCLLCGIPCIWLASFLIYSSFRSVLPFLVQWPLVRRMLVMTRQCRPCTRIPTAKSSLAQIFIQACMQKTRSMGLAITKNRAHVSFLRGWSIYKFPSFLWSSNPSFCLQPNLIKGSVATLHSICYQSLTDLPTSRALPHQKRWVS